MSQTLESLASQWRNAKKAEAQARDERVALESQIIEQTGLREEGSMTVNAGEWKVKVTCKLTRKLDAETWERIKHTIPEAMQPVSYAPKLEIKGLRYLEKNEPEVFAKVAQAIEMKPAKPSIEVK